MRKIIERKWLFLLVPTGILAFLYLWFILFPGAIRQEGLAYFTEQQLLNGRNYVTAYRLADIISFVLQLTILGWFVFSGRAEALSQQLCRWLGCGIWGGRLAFFIFLWLILRLLNLPFTLFVGYWWEQYWGFLTQSLSAWWRDYFLSAGLDFLLSFLGAALLFLAMDYWPRGWWLAGATFTGVWLLVQTLLWPVVIAPLFNDFQPVHDPAVLGMVQELSQKAGIEVGEVLVMDASRRTTAANAYFTGLGKTKRIVLYDTLLRDYSLQQVKAVVAHEMAHWRHAHIIKGIVGGVLGSILLWALLFYFLEGLRGLRGFYPPHALAVIALFLLLVTFLSRPVENYFSRQMEFEADRTAGILTEDIAGAVKLQVDLAAKNLADVSPPAFIEWFSYSHPSTLVRIRSILTIGQDSSIILE